eukprot:2951366-Pyramimonas_sp.AAC.1
MPALSVVQNIFVMFSLVAKMQTGARSSGSGRSSGLASEAPPLTPGSSTCQAACRRGPRKCVTFARCSEVQLRPLCPLR